ncbi:MAG TPA: protease inhibitor I42 family protein [Geobacteraceae bacterium]|nr:protease inhibitor I42 family protein [Geobacteraceae bacterium]
MKLLVIFTILLCSCTISQVNTAENFSDPAKPVKIPAGSEFTLTLESNRTTGYQWQLAKSPDEAVVQFVGNKYEVPDTKLIGAGGKEIWTFKAVGKGKTEIALKYVRPWEKDVPPVKEAVFTVVVE